MTQALYRKYRPQGWAAVIGQDHVVLTLKNAIKADRVAHAYLFAGPRGTGKTTVARLLAKAVNCLAPDAAGRPCNQCEICKAANESRLMDLIEIDAASNTGVDDVRDLRDKINFAPTQGKYKIYIVDEVHMLSTPAFNALLKTLEEPPPHVIFILATTELHKIPATVLSRCQRHEFRRVPVAEIVRNLKEIAAGENIEADDDALTLIARQSAGGMRDAQSLLDQLASTGERITVPLVQTVLGTATSQTVLEVIESIIAGDPKAGLESLHAALDGGAEARSLARQVVEYLRGLMLIQMGNAGQVEAALDVKKQMEIHAKALTSGEVLRLTRIFNAAAMDQRGGWQPSLGLELALAEAMETPPTPAAATPSAVVSHSRPQAESKPARAAVPQKPKQAEQVVHQESSQPPAGQSNEKTTITAGDIIAAWKDIQHSLPKEHANLKALLNSVKTIEIQGKDLILGFASDVLVTKMDRPGQVEAAQKVIADRFGVQLTIHCVVTNAKGKIPSDVPQDGMVATAIRQGGEIVDHDR